MKHRTPVLVVPHTHWDRDWFWPLERFRVKLIELFDVMIGEFRKHPDYRFTLDGQTVMLEDYLEARPADAPFLRRMAKQGRLKIGPMYVLSDLYCTGGESLIRNLLIGREIAEAFGGSQRHLHMPDTFGILPSIPMIAAGFGIPTFTFMRGTVGQAPGMTSMHALKTELPPQFPAETRLFLWTTPDGSSVRVIRLRDGYANAAARMGADPQNRGIMWRYDVGLGAKAMIAAARRQADGQGEPLLLLAGVDHQIPEPAQRDAMQRATHESGFDFRFSDLDEMSAVTMKRDPRRWPRYEGEFHGSGGASVLGGTVSSRIYLKQKNAEVEQDLTQAAEPADAIATLAGGDDPAAASLRIAWKHLLKTHPHDDICGCSVDAVHRDNEYLMRQAADAADAVRRRMTRDILCTFGGNREGDNRFSFALINGQPFARRCRARVKCDFEGRLQWGDYKPPRAYAIVDEAGREVPFRVLTSGRSTEHPHAAAVLEVAPDLAPLTVQRFYIEARPRWPRTRQAAARIENEHLRIDARRNGTFDVLCKSTGRVYTGLGVFSDQADVGDTYDFADLPTERETVFDRTRFTVDRGEGCSGMRTLAVCGVLRVPESSARGGRASRKVPIPVCVEVSLAPGERHADCRLQFENRSSDHRLRFNLPLPFRPAFSRAGLKFGEVVRPAGRPPRGREAPRVHPEHPADPYVSVESRQGGLALFTEFPINYEVVTGSRPRLAATVLRSVGFLSRGDMSTRKGNAGPDTPTPEAQCLGRAFDMRFAVRPFAAGESGALLREATLWRSAPVAAQIEGYYPPRRDIAQGAFLHADSAAVLISAFKRRQSGHGVVVRFFNPSAQPCSTRIAVRGVKELIPVGLDERPTDRHAARRLGDGAFELRMPPFSLQTFAIGERHPWKPE